MTTDKSRPLGHYHAIPGNLRDMPWKNSKKIEWVNTPQGLIESGCEMRLQLLFGEKEQDPQAFIEELVRIGERALAISQGALPVIHVPPAKNNNSTLAPTQVKKSRIVRSKVVTPSVESRTDKLSRMAMYIYNGDIGNIVPSGEFISDEEKRAWSNFITVEIMSFGPSKIVDKQSIRCIRQSNSTGGPLLAESYVKLMQGMAVVEVNEQNIITNVLAVDTIDAKFIFAPFNRLFRKKF